MEFLVYLIVYLSAQVEKCLCKLQEFICGYQIDSSVWCTVSTCLDLPSLLEKKQCFSIKQSRVTNASWGNHSALYRQKRVYKMTSNITLLSQYRTPKGTAKCSISRSKTSHSLVILQLISLAQTVGLFFFTAQTEGRFLKCPTSDASLKLQHI